MSDIAPDPLAACARRLRDAGFGAIGRAVIDDASARFPERADIRAEQLRYMHQAGDPEAVASLLDLRARGLALPWALAVEVGASAGRWDVVTAAAREWIDSIVYDTLEDADPWIPRAVLAGAQLAVGEAHARNALLEACPRHPDALSVLVRIERRLGHARASEDEERLRAAAAEAWRRLDRPEVLPWI
jgi:hypothetical protein